MKTSSTLLTLAAVAALLLSACSKEKRTVRQLEGTWNVASLEQESKYTGDCGVPESVYRSNAYPNVGSITFGDGATITIHGQTGFAELTP